MCGGGGERAGRGGGHHDTTVGLHVGSGWSLLYGEMCRKTQPISNCIVKCQTMPILFFILFFYVSGRLRMRRTVSVLFLWILLLTLLSQIRAGCKLALCFVCSFS